jgi:hypothetical protein
LVAGQEGAFYGQGEPRGAHSTRYRQDQAFTSGSPRSITKAGLDGVEFHPFFMRFDLPEPEDKSGTPVTYTVKQGNGNRLSFGGSLYQPWCHVTATKV